MSGFWIRCLIVITCVLWYHMGEGAGTVAGENNRKTTMILSSLQPERIQKVFGTTRILQAELFREGVSDLMMSTYGTSESRGV